MALRARRTGRLADTGDEPRRITMARRKSDAATRARQAVADIPEQLAALRNMTVAQLREKYRDVFGEPTRSRNKDYVELADMWSRCPKMRSMARHGTPMTPHILGRRDGVRQRRRTTLSFVPDNACMPSRGGMAPSPSMRGEQA